MLKHSIHHLQEEQEHQAQAADSEGKVESLLFFFFFIIFLKINYYIITFLFI